MMIVSVQRGKKRETPTQIIKVSKFSHSSCVNIFSLPLREMTYI